MDCGFKFHRRVFIIVSGGESMKPNEADRIFKISLFVLVLMYFVMMVMLAREVF